MKRTQRLTTAFAVCFSVAATLVATSFVACGEKNSSAAGGTGEKLWQSETVEHKNFKDLGNYVIELPDYTDAASSTPATTTRVSSTRTV